MKALGAPIRKIFVRIARMQLDKAHDREIGLSPRTVEMHVALAMKALTSAIRPEAVHRANSEGLLE